jgi:FtsP/CotA-like multicopper oxidase with cupredoxin domain
MAPLRHAVISALISLPLLVYSATQSLEWNITYTTANPDGLFERRVMGVNGNWPPPPIELNFGDRLVLNVNNQLDDVVTGLHTHGLFQNGTNYYDGPVGVVQWYQNPIDSRHANIKAALHQARVWPTILQFSRMALIGSTLT